MFETATEIMGRPVEAGLQFIWAISFGQLISIGLFVLGMIGGAIKLGSIVLALRSQALATEKRIDNLEETIGDRMDGLVRDISAIESETRKDLRDLRTTIHDLNKTLLAVKIIGVDVRRIAPSEEESE